MKDAQQPSDENGWLDHKLPREHVGDAILGASDGIITTFAVVAGATGGGFSGAVMVVLGFASLLADGLSMGVSNYLGSKSDRQLKQTLHEEEMARIDAHPEQERQRLRQIYRREGLPEELVDQIVDSISQDRERWAQQIVNHEEGRPQGTSVVWSGVATALAFMVAGAIPLLPFVFGGGAGGGGAGFLNAPPAFYLSAGVAAITFFIVGSLKGRVVGQAWWRAGLQTLLTGGIAAIVAYAVGVLLRQVAGVQGGA